MRWKAGALLFGVVVVAIGIGSFVNRRAEVTEAREAASGLAAARAAGQLDAHVRQTAATLAFVAVDVDLDAVAGTLGTSVCTIRPVLRCARSPQRVDALVDITEQSEGFADPALDAAFRAASERATRSGTAGTAVATPPDGPAAAIVVAVERTEQHFLAVLALDEIELEPVAVGGDRRVGAAVPALDDAGRSWQVRSTAVDAPPGVWSGQSPVTVLVLTAGTVVVAVALIALSREHRGLRLRATTDSLTGLPNRAEFERRAAARLAQLERDDGVACLVVVDLDGFKSINDSIGHAGGDRVLTDAGQRLAAAVRSSDLVGRWGGDEFVLLLDGVANASTVSARTEAIVSSMRAVTASDGTRLGASAGAAVFPRDGRDLATLTAIADAAMYAAKAGGASSGGASRAPVVP